MADITHKQKQLVLGLLRGMSVHDIAIDINVKECTIYQWLSKEDLKAFIRLESNRLYIESFTRLSGLLGQCVTSLENILLNGTDKNRLTAIALVFSNLDKLKALDIEDRLSKLEEKANLENISDIL